MSDLQKLVYARMRQALTCLRTASKLDGQIEHERFKRLKLSEFSAPLSFKIDLLAEKLEELIREYS